MIDIAWMAAGLGAVYGAASLVAAQYFIEERMPRLRLIPMTLLWLPVMILGFLNIILKGKVMGVRGVNINAGPVTAKMWLGPSIGRFGFAFIKRDNRKGI